jgi:uncharacterized protein
MADIRECASAAARLIQDAGGEIVGKTRLQKAAYFLECLGLGSGFEFYYKHYGPYSDELTNSLRYARDLGLIEEEDKKAAWGGIYTVFRSQAGLEADHGEVRDRVLAIARDANPVALELAATALFLKIEGEGDPWTAVKSLKPSKATKENVTIAKRLYDSLRKFEAPKNLPAL